MMKIDWAEVWKFSQWFITAALGAIIIKVVDTFFQKSKETKLLKIEKINRLLEIIEEYANLADLFRLYARYSSKLVPIENPDPNKDWVQNSKVEKEILEPEEKFVQAINRISGKSLDESITERILNLKLSSAQITDLSDEVDPSGELSNQFRDLFIKAALSLSNILVDKDKLPDPFITYLDSLKESENIRKSIRSKLEKMKS